MLFNPSRATGMGPALNLEYISGAFSLTSRGTQNLRALTVAVCPLYQPPTSPGIPIASILYLYSTSK